MGFGFSCVRAGDLWLLARWRMNVEARAPVDYLPLRRPGVALRAWLVTPEPTQLPLGLGDDPPRRYLIRLIHDELSLGSDQPLQHGNPLPSVGNHLHHGLSEVQSACQRRPEWSDRP